MAIKVYNGTNWDDTFGSATIGGTNVSVLAAGITSLGNTAPNTTNQALGVILAIVTLPTTANWTVELMESGVSKASGTINLADFRAGFCYVRFTTPYTFTTTAAGAYTIKVTSSSGTQGSLRTITAGNLWNLIVYNTNTTLGATDDAWIGGFVNAGITTKTLTISGTSNSWGSGADNAMVSTTQWSMGAATTIFNGGSLIFDTAASTTLTQLGSIIVYRNGLFDMRANASDITKVSTLSFNQQATDGRFGILHPGNALAGQVLTTGKTVPVYAQFASGTGTAANPVVTQAAHGLSVNDELIFGGATDYLKNERRYVISIPSSTQLVLSSTLGGAENALTQTHAVGSYVGNLTRNSIIKNTTTTAGFWIMNFDSNQTPVSSYNYTRAEYPNCLSGKGIAINGASTTVVNGNDATHDGFVVYHNSAAARNTITVTGVVAQTITGVILYNTRGTNYAAQSGYCMQSASNKTVNYLLHFADPSGTTNAAGISLNGAVSNTINNFHSYGANANNGSSGYALGIFSSFNNVLNNCSINGSRVQGIYYSSSLNNTFNNISMGVAGTNAIDLFTVSSTYNTALFNNGTFSSATLISNYLNQLDGSDIKFHKYQATAHKHRWYTNRGYANATGTGLEDTTVRTAGSYNIELNPENNSGGFVWEFTVKSIVDQISFLKAYLRKNTTMGTSVAKVELFMPGTDTTGTADAIFTASNTTGTWQDFVIGKAYTGTENTEALIRVTAISATAGAAIYLADFYDSTDALNSWFEAKPTKTVAPTDFTAVAGLLWSYPDTGTTSGTMGRRQVDAADSAELASIK